MSRYFKSVFFSGKFIQPNLVLAGNDGGIAYTLKVDFDLTFEVSPG